MNDEAQITAIKIEKRLCGALLRQWSPSGMSVETLANDAADKIEHLRKVIRAIDRANDNPVHYNAEINALCESA